MRLALLLLGCACEAGAIGGRVCDDGEPLSVRVPRATSTTDLDWPDEEILPAIFETPPYLALVADDVVALRWRSTSAASARARVSAGGDFGHAVELPVAIQHRVRFTDLEPGAAYGYEVEMNGAVRRGTFRAPGGALVRAVQVGEFHAPSASPEAAAFGPVIREFSPHLLIESGDMVDDGQDLTHWIDYLRSSAAWISNVLLLPAHSNHVGGEAGVDHMRCVFELPEDRVWYATRYGLVEVLTIASESELIDGQKSWMRGSAEAAHDGEDDPAFLLASWHHPACSSHYESRASTRERIMEDVVAELVAGGGVDLVLVGHDKYYERSTIEGGIPHVMTNAGRVSPGKPGNNHPMCTTEATALEGNTVLLLELDDARIAMRAVRPDGSTLDELEIAR